MPKIIAGVKDKIIREAGEIIARGDYSAFSARQIAAASSIAVGTLYNYFPSMESLIVTVIGGEWHQLIDEIDRGCQQAHSVAEGLDCMMKGMYRFSDKYYGFWATALKASDTLDLGGSWHDRLISETAERIDKLFTRLGCVCDKRLLPAMAEIIVSLSASRVVEPESACGLVTAVADRLCGGCCGGRLN